MEVRDSALHFEAVYTFQKKSKDGVVIHLAIHPHEVPTDLLTAMIGSRFMVAMVQLNDQDEPVPVPGMEEGAKAVASAGELCKNTKFQKWLSYTYLTDIDNEADAADLLKMNLGITSRSELRTNDKAREEFNAIKDQFLTDYKSGKIR